MNAGDMEGVEVELKYCERCGGLWFRRAGSDEVYCASCALAADEVMRVGSRRRTRLPLNDGKPKRIFGENVVVYSEGGNA